MFVAGDTVEFKRHLCCCIAADICVENSVKPLKSETKRCCFTPKFDRNMDEVHVCRGRHGRIQKVFVLPHSGGMEINL